LAACAALWAVRSVHVDKLEEGLGESLWETLTQCADVELEYMLEMNFSWQLEDREGRPSVFVAQDRKDLRY
jgi:hypothetical protein